MTTTVTINLLGKPSVEHPGSDPVLPRSRKTWALLTYLLLSERPPSRSRLSALLFAEADDPLRALRWNLSELRRVLGPNCEVGGDPVELTLPPDVAIDIRLITKGMWKDAIGLPSLGDDLLVGLESIGGPEFESWLLAERRHIAASTEDVLHEAALGLLARGEPEEAVNLAVTLVGMNPYLESHHALLIRAYLTAGDEEAAHRQYEACTELFVRELGMAPGPSVRAELESRPQLAPPVGDAAFDAVMEAGMAALAAGAREAGVVSLRTGVVLADSLGDPRRRITARLALGGAVFHSVSGGDEEGTLILHEAAYMAADASERDLLAETRVELGYLDMLKARYNRAEQWLAPKGLVTEDDGVLARAYSYLGCMQSDRADYAAAEKLLGRAVVHSRAAQSRALEAYATSLLGRLHFLCGDYELAFEVLQRSLDLNDSFAFVPWPQTFLGEVKIEQGDLESAAGHLERAFARASQIGDPCWEGVSRRGLALVAEGRGDTAEAFTTLQDAAERCNRRSDTYVWAKAYILDAQCSLGLLHSHASTGAWIEALYNMATRTGMREFQVRAMMHRTAFGIRDERTAAMNLAEDIGNPRLFKAMASA